MPARKAGGPGGGRSSFGRESPPKAGSGGTADVRFVRSLAKANKAPPLHRAGVVGILCAGGFPARAAPGARIIPNSPPRRAEARKAGRPAARGTVGKNFLKKVLDTAERAR